MGALDCVSNDRIKSADSTDVFTIMASSNSCLSEPRPDLESQCSKSNSGDKHSIWWTLGLDIPLLIIVLLLVGLFELGVLPTYKGGFYCKDVRLSHEFTGETISMAAIVLTILLIPIPVLFGTELALSEADYSQRSRVNQALRNTIWLYRSYAYGLFLNFTIIEVMKFITGMPRPTFFAICQPDTNINCKESEYVSTFKCTPSERFSSWFQNDSYHSFPSGHTSLSVHCGLFLAWYLQRRAFHWQHRTIFLVPVLQAVVLGYAAVCSLTRITDHRHHWWDVLVGTGIGIATAVYAVFALCSNFRQYSKEGVVGDVAPNDLMFTRRSRMM